MITAGQFVDLLKDFAPRLLVIVHDNNSNTVVPINNVWISDNGKRVYVIYVEGDENYWYTGDLWNQLESYKNNLEVRFVAFAKDGNTVITEFELDDFGHRVYLDNLNQDVFMISGI